MGNTINKIDEGFYICGVEALCPARKLKELGITCIVNAADADLYRDIEHEMQDGLKDFDVKIIGAEDTPAYNLGAHFEVIADFIEAGRAKGGVVVHCAAGISRASTSACAYLLIKEHWTLEAAYARVRGVRPCCRPNQGFWRQLRELEASLILQGVELRSLPDDYVFPEQPEQDREAESPDRKATETAQRIRTLDEEAANSLVEKFHSTYLTAVAEPVDGVTPAQLADRLSKSTHWGISWEIVKGRDELGIVSIRAGLACFLNSDAFLAVLTKTPEVKSARVEGAYVPTS